MNAVGAPATLRVPLRIEAKGLASPVTAEATLQVGVARTAKPQSKGDGATKELKANSRVTLEFAADETLANQDVTVVEYPAEPITNKQQRGLLMQFGPAATFKQPVTLTVNLDDVFSTALLDAGYEPVLIYWPDAPEKVEIIGPDGKPQTVEAIRSRRMPSTFDASSKTLTAKLDHFSVYEVIPGLKNQSGPQPWKLTANLGSVSPFRGAANYAHPIEVMPMQGGLQPALSLAYSSAAADGYSMDDARLGVGWSLDVPHIRQGIKFEGHDVQYSTGMARWYSVQVNDDYRLSIGGQEYNLIPKGIAAGAYGEYVPETYAPIRAFKCQVGQTCNGQAAIPWATWNSQPYWQVWLPDGTRWVFGGTGASTKWYASRGNHGAAVQTWFIRRVYAPGRDNPSTSSGQADLYSAEYNYVETVSSACGTNQYGQTDCGQGYDYDSRVRLSYVNYGNSRGASWPQYQVSVGYTDTTDTGRLTNIWVNRKSGAAFATIRYYGAFYNFYGQLESVIETGYDGVNWFSRPGTAFLYGAYAPPQDETKHLKIVNNGYGGQTEFNYETLPSGYRRVNGLVQKDVNTGWASFKTYTYTGACFNTAGSTCRTGHDWNEPNDALVGHSQVDEVQRAGAPYDWNAVALQTVRHAFHVDTHRLGRESATSVLDGGSNGNTLHLTERTWNDVPASSLAAGWPGAAWAAELSKTRTYPFGNSGAGAAFWSEVEHSYESVLAAPLIRQENATRTRTSSGAGQRTDFTRYTWNTGAGAWIIKPAWVNTYAGIVTTFNPGCASGLKSQVLLYYDGNNTNTSATPTRGLVTKATTGSTCPNEKNATQYFGYDGAAVGAISATGAGNLTSAQDPKGNPATTAVYDGMGLFMTQLTNPAGHVEKYYYLGVNLTSVDARGQYGQLEAVDDPNNARTNYSYDALGRLKKVIKPGNTHVRPTVEYFYMGTNGVSDLNAGFAGPLMVQSFTRKEANAGATVNGSDTAWWACSTCGVDLNALAFFARAYYDGFGRAIQSQQPAADWPGVGNRTLSYTQYDVFGRTSAQSVPYDALDTAPWYSTPDLNKPRITTTYDAMGRALTVTGPDNVTTTYDYGLNTVGAVTSIRDANGHLKQHIADPLGRMIRVREYAGTYPNFGGYDTTRYDYDIAGNLIDVWDAANNNTHITYDALNRKTSMSDPDMGAWSYDYDLNGNLTWQRDANQTVLTFVYDALNRMTDKYVNGAWTSWHRFDETNVTANALGRRTRMGQGVWQGNNWSNETYFFYDARGRMTTEHRFVDGVGLFDTSYAYDSANRVTTMTYPNGEQVTTNYSAAGNPLSLAGWQTYVSEAKYNTFGRPSTIKWGNTLKTRYRYMGADIVNPPGYGAQNFGRLRQVCVLPESETTDCYDWAFNPGGTQNTRMNIGYWYDAVGNVSAFDEYDKGYNTGFSYDERDRLTSASGATNETYSYDAIGNLTSKGGVAMYYWDAAHKHALTNLSLNNNAQMAWYDANGNMFQRKEGGTTYSQTWDADNRLTRVTSTAGGRNADTQFFYDADGQLVKKVEQVSDKPFIEDGFENVNGPLWQYNGYQTLGFNDGGQQVLKNTGAGGYTWASNFARYCCDLISGRSMVVDFKVDNANSAAHFSVETNQGGYSRFGVIADVNKIFMQTIIGGNVVHTDLINPVKVNTWYRVWLILDDANGFKAEVWERDAGSPYATLTAAMPAGKQWNFHHWINAGNAYLDNYQQRFLGGYKWTAYLGPHAEWSSETATNYYLFNGQRVAMRDNWVMAWLHGDQLGSASLMTDGGGNTVGQVRYKPFGEKRSEWNAYFSDRKFTGQREEYALGSLYHYGARFYSPLLGRFLSADSIVPGAGNPQALNRYAYSFNSPLNYTDPTGHDPWWKPDALKHAAASLTQLTGSQIMGEVERGVMTPLEGFAQMVERAWQASYRNMDTFMWAMANVILGINPDAQSEVWALPFIVYAGNTINGYVTRWNNASGMQLPGYDNIPGRNPYRIGGRFAFGATSDPRITREQSGVRADWGRQFTDGTDTQAYHYWFFVAVAYYNGSMTAVVGNDLHDSPNPQVREVLGSIPSIGGVLGGGYSEADHNLGVAGALAGTYFRLNQNLSVNPGDVVRLLKAR